MRVTSDFFVSALIRRVFASGGFAAVEARGAAEAGAIFIVVRDRMGGARLFGPAAQTSYEPGKVEGRLFVSLMEGEGEAIDKRLAKERRFDTDAWIVDLEPGPVEIATLIDLARG